MTMIERVAAAIAKVPVNYPTSSLQQAKAAIEALRMPTEAMINIVGYEGFRSKESDEEFIKVWNLILDATLKENPK